MINSTKFANFAEKVFRKKFQHIGKDVAHYFPDHMAKGLERMQRTLMNVDCIVEVHDARIPFSGRNPQFEDSLMVRPHLLVLNKIDLTSMDHQKAVEAKLRRQGIRKILYTCCKENVDKTIKSKLIPAVLELIEGADRYNRANEESFNVLIIGIPNVGKSSVINALRRTHLHKGGKATPVGALAGVTRSVMEKIRVCDKPLIYVFDSPGILSPDIPNMDVAMKLALCATLRDHKVGVQTVADYLLYILNKYQYFNYVEFYGLEEPTDDILYLLTHIAKQHNLVQQLKSPSGGIVYRPNFVRAAQIILADFRECRLGKVILDQDLLNGGRNKTEAVNNFN